MFARDDALIAPREEVFDAERIWATFERAVRECSDASSKRLAATKLLKSAFERGHTRIRQAFETELRSGARVSRSIAALTDDVVRLVFRFATEHLFYISNPTKGEHLSVVAVGGYGRGEMAPYSDVDLLFLTPYKDTAWSESVVEAMLYMLWDLRLKVGHSTRRVSDCLRLAGSDMTIRTTLLEKRFLCGDAALFETLDQRLRRELFEKTGPAFLEAKLTERDQRHQRGGGSRYVLEPNVKEGKGGLRDLQTLYWITKYLYGVESVEDLVEKEVFTDEEVARFRKAEAHLWTVRCGLHYVAGRAQERMSFENQVELAEAFGYRESAGQMPVERFMKRYFVSAREVGELTRIFCASLEAQHRKPPPLLGVARFLTGSDNGAIEGAPHWLERRDGRLMVSRADRLKDPRNIVKLFEAAVRLDIMIHPASLRLIDRYRRSMDDALARYPEIGATLVDLLAHSRDPVRAMRRMTETGVLGRLLPEFGRITGMMQFNMYHHYTVDEHTIQSLQALNQMRTGALREEHPVETKILEASPDLRVLSVALLLHDIGKGLPEDHSIAGERIAREVGPQLGLSEAEVERVAWLVRWHLAMSDVAQKRDISDPATVRGFAELVRSPERLKQLYVLTACDIRAVGPGVWNGWKGQLLRQLYCETRTALVGDEAAQSRPQRIAAAQDSLREALQKNLAEWPAGRAETHLERFYPSYWLGLDLETHVLHAEMIRQADEGATQRPKDAGALHMRATPAAHRAATMVAFYTTDHPGLIARMTGAFALANASVVDARAYTTKDGMAVNTFWVQDEEEGAYDDPNRLERLERYVMRALNGEVVPREALRERRRMPRRERSFQVPPSVEIDNSASDTFTVIEVNGRDRVGLLHELTRALSVETVNIFSAIIATYGEHAVDVFYVRDVFGMKIHAESKKARLKTALMTVLKAGDGGGDA
ncbi:MAG: [protein-PII] uridylyltransferase [Rhodobacteraceae bacterium]|nr:[protein-PII] uridylyltransferase [Paracoccaceae bacterium]